MSVSSRKIDFGTTAAAPTFEGIIKGNIEANKSISDGLLGLTNQVKTFAKDKTERNTEAMLAGYNNVKTLEDLDSADRNVRSLIENELYNNVNQQKINEYVNAKPASIMESINKQNVLDTFTSNTASDAALASQARLKDPGKYPDAANYSGIQKANAEEIALNDAAIRLHAAKNPRGAGSRSDSNDPNKPPDLVDKSGRIESGVGQMVYNLVTNEVTQVTPEQAQAQLARSQGRDGTPVDPWKAVYGVPGGMPGVPVHLTGTNYDAKYTSLPTSLKEGSTHRQLAESLVPFVLSTESSGNPNAVSPKDAQGLMQIMPGTRGDILKNHGIDSYASPQENIRGGTAYLEELSKLYNGNVSLVLAAYNGGMGNVAEYGGVPPFEETQNYVSRINRKIGEAAAKGEIADIPKVGPLGGSMAQSQATRDPDTISLPIREYLEAQSGYQTNLTAAIQAVEQVNSNANVMEAKSKIAVLMDKHDKRWFGRGIGDALREHSATLSKAGITENASDTLKMLETLESMEENNTIFRMSKYEASKAIYNLYADVRNARIAEGHAIYDRQFRAMHADLNKKLAERQQQPLNITQAVFYMFGSEKAEAAVKSLNYPPFGSKPNAEVSQQAQQLVNQTSGGQTQTAAGGASVAEQAGNGAPKGAPTDVPNPAVENTGDNSPTRQTFVDINNGIRSAVLGTGNAIKSVFVNNDPIYQKEYPLQLDKNGEAVLPPLLENADRPLTEQYNQTKGQATTVSRLRNAAAEAIASSKDPKVIESLNRQYSNALARYNENVVQLTADSDRFATGNTRSGFNGGFGDQLGKLGSAIGSAYVGGANLTDRALNATGRFLLGSSGSGAGEGTTDVPASIAAQAAIPRAKTPADESFLAQVRNIQNSPGKGDGSREIANRAIGNLPENREKTLQAENEATIARNIAAAAVEAKPVQSSPRADIATQTAPKVPQRKVLGYELLAAPLSSETTQRPSAEVRALRDQQTATADLIAKATVRYNSIAEGPLKLVAKEEIRKLIQESNNQVTKIRRLWGLDK